jgi:hypothetical protein
MHRWSEADGDVVEGLGLGLVLEGLGLGLVLVALGVGLGEVVVGVGEGVAEALEDALALGVGVALADALAEALEDAPALGVGVALALLTDTAVSWAAHGLAAASAGVALPISKIPVSPARKIKNPETMPNARVVARRLRMGYALATVVIPVRVALVAMVSPVNAGSIPRSSHSTPGRLIKGSARPKGI